jgi:sterol desaturase/sphingolipid hydroxylase (fatty acid hydroxylase superfamily)
MADPAAPAGSAPAELFPLLAAFAEQRLRALFVELPGWFVDGGHRFFWVYLLAFVLLGAIAYRRSYSGTPAASGGFLRFLFPRDLYRHPSALLDLKLLLMNRFLGPSTLLARLLLGPLSVTWVATMTQSVLLGLAGEDHAPTAWSAGTLAVFVVATALVADFATYVVHSLHHRWPLLWEFHKVHHTAEVLTPLTVYRKHPVYNLLSRVTNIAIVGPFGGVIAFLFVGTADPVTLFGANVVFSLFHLLGANLRHSHVWLSFGPRLSHVFISPAQHQIHHSKAPEHWDKNFGEVFALWDWAFGTLYVPGREREALEFGVAGAGGREHGTLWQIYSVPFANCGRLIRRRAARFLPAAAPR